MHLPHPAGEPCPPELGADSGAVFARKKVFIAPALGAQRRARLADLNSHFHCSVIGTCLTTAELRRLIARFKDIDRERTSDVEIHHAAVELAGEDGAGCKALNKALDDRYEASIKRFRVLKTLELLTRHWRQCVTQGDIPGAYWAVLTHPMVNSELRRLVFGEVHMLSHLVGASNRADIRRLLHLEQQNDQLRQDLEQQRAQLQRSAAELAQLRREQLASQREISVTRARAAGTEEAHSATELQHELRRLQLALEQKDVALRHQAERREQVEMQAQQQKLDLAAASEAMLHAQHSITQLEAQLSEEEPDSIERESVRVLRGRKLLYVGGRPAAISAIRSLVESAGGQLISHGGSLEQRRGMLPALVASSDLVVFPVDCIDHDSVASVKRECERQRIAYHPLRTSSAAAFAALVTRLARVEQSSPLSA